MGTIKESGFRGGNQVSRDAGNLLSVASAKEGAGDTEI
jgi:hypothetical protein